MKVRFHLRFCRTFYIILFILIFLTRLPSLEAKTSPEMAGFLSIVPGLGQAVNGAPFEGLVWFTSSIGLYLVKNGYSKLVGFDLWMYNMYDAYRDAGARNAKKHNLIENWPLAVFNPLNAIDPIGAPMVGLTAVSTNPKNSIRGPRNKLFTPLVFTAVAGGEEGLFRGFLYPALSDLFHSKLIGASASSALFSVFHLSNGISFDANPSVMIVRVVMGMLLCWQVTRNDYDLRKSTFTHAWIDIIVDWKGGGIKPISSIGQSLGTIQINHSFRF